MRDDAGRGSGPAEEQRGAGESRGSATDDRVDDAAGDGERPDDGDDGSAGNVAGEFGPAASIEPQSVSLENALLVTVGVYLAAVGLVWLFVDAGTMGVGPYLALTGVVIAGALVSAWFFGVSTPDT